MSDGYRLATSALTTRCATPAREEVQRRPAVRRAVARLVRGQRHAGTEVRADEQRIDHAGCRAGIREPLVASRRHPGERERGAAEHPRERRDLLDVRSGVSPHAGRVAPVDLVDAIAGDLLALRAWRCRGAAPRP